MNDDVSEILRPLMHEGDRVYLLRRNKKRNWLWGIGVLIDIVWSYGLVTGLMGTAADVSGAASKSWYLIASSSAGTIAHIQDGEIVETIDVPRWRPLLKDDFRSVTIGEYRFTRIGTSL